MEIYSCLDSEADLSQWGIEIPLLYSRPKQITSYLTKKLGANPVLEAKYKLLESKDLLLAHTKEYINKLTSNAHVDETMMNIFELVKDDGTFHRYKRENQKRPFSELFMHQLVEASGTFSCAKKAYLEKKDIHFLSGGMHHAMTDQGRGFCSLNDQVIAARKLQKENNLKDVWVIDLDVHKGDGTAECTKDDSSISTLSIHMKNGWPFDESWRPGPWDTPSTVDIEIGINQETFPKNSGERKFSPMDRSLRRELKSTFGNNNYWFNTSKFKNAVEIKIRSENEVIEFLVPKDMVSASSVRLFLLWTTLPSIVLIIIALIFLKNQTKPLVKLAKAAERFGKGDYVNDFRASGSQEIRKAAFEFDRMAKRINRHLNQRAEMLSGISHDLRTPLTRLKLQLAMLKQKDISESMSKDIDEMEKMLNDYLQFAKTQVQEPSTIVNLNDLLISIRNKFNNNNFTFNESSDLIELKGRLTALQRSFENIIQNGLTYGKKVNVEIQKGNRLATILFEDDGPGIPEDQYKNVFKPFFRLDKSRSLNQSGVGLGLAIVEDVINSHGGNIQLGKSKKNGLLVKISLPF